MMKRGQQDYRAGRKNTEFRKPKAYFYQPNKLLERMMLREQENNFSFRIWTYRTCSTKMFMSTSFVQTKFTRLGILKTFQELKVFSHFDIYSLISKNFEVLCKFNNALYFGKESIKSYNILTLQWPAWKNFYFIQNFYL